MNKRSKIIIGAVVIVVALVAGIGGYFTWQSLQPPATTTPIKVGAVLSLSGSYATVGRYYETGYTMWADDLNEKGGLLGRPVQMVFADDRSDPTVAVTSLEKFITVDKVDLLLGPYASPIVYATMVVNEKYKMPMVEAGGAVESAFERGFKYSFMTIVSQTQKAKAYIAFVNSLNPHPQTISVLAEDSALWKPFSQDLNTFAQEVGLSVVATELYATGTVDFIPLLIKLKEANADIFIAACYDQASIIIQKQAKEAGFEPKLFVYTTGAPLPTFLEGVGVNNANYAAGGSEWEPIIKEEFGPGTSALAEDYRAKYSADPPLYVAMAYGAAQVLEAAVKQVGSLDNEAIRNAIANIDIKTVNGPVRFDERGINIAKTYPMMQWQNGQKQVVFPAEASTATVLYPTPGWNQR